MPRARIVAFSLSTLVPLAVAACHSPAAPLPPPAPCTDDPATIYDAPRSLDFENGHVLKCGVDAPLAAGDLDRIARTAGYLGDPLTSGASLVRILYRTERGTEPPTPGFSSAVVLLPDHPRASTLPVVVVAHGTIGEAPACPPSQESETGDATYLAELGYPLVGEGYAVILPDFAGYAGFGAAGNPPSGYHDAADEAKSVLDAARALRAIRPALFNAETILVGHSQGGHAVLSALAMHEAYGSGGNLAGVVAYAPSWFSMSSFGALLATPENYPLATEYDTVAATVWYHYSHAELHDGPGAGALLFAPAKRDAIRHFFDESCDEKALSALGTNVGDLFDPSFTEAVAVRSALGSICTDEPCATWLSRYHADRPHITGSATKVPILVVYGDADDWIPAERAVCGFDRLSSDQANATICIVPGAKHDPVVGARSEYVGAWIASKALGAGDPGSCGAGRETLHDDAGAPVLCATPPPND